MLNLLFVLCGLAAFVLMVIALVSAAPLRLLVCGLVSVTMLALMLAVAGSIAVAAVVGALCSGGVVLAALPALSVGAAAGRPRTAFGNWPMAAAIGAVLFGELGYVLWVYFGSTVFVDMSLWRGAGAAEAVIRALQGKYAAELVLLAAAFVAAVCGAFVLRQTPVGSERGS